MREQEGPDTPKPSHIARLDALRSMLYGFGSVCVGYSGGVDSVFLAVTAVDSLGAERVLAVTGVSDAVPAAQRDMARECAAAFGIPHLEISTDEVDNPAYAANPSNRCYHCKTELWSKLDAVAGERGLAVVVDGANADDVGDHRPGALAAREHAVRSPLLEVGLTKAEIRALSRMRGLPTWDQPASPCLASRLPYGVAVTRERLGQVESAEAWMRRSGFREFRVRHHGNAARIEVARQEMERALTLRTEIHTALSALGFAHVLLDAEGYRRGALNEMLTPVRITQHWRAPAASSHREVDGLQLWPAGTQHEIACMSAPADPSMCIVELAGRIRARGFRYLAFDLRPDAGAPTEPARAGWTIEASSRAASAGGTAPRRGG